MYKKSERLRQFYNSRRWTRLAAYVMTRDNYTCVRCKLKPAQVVHHTVYLTDENVGNPAVALNPAHLESLCLDCHNREHFGDKPTMTRGIFFDDSGQPLL